MIRSILGFVIGALLWRLGGYHWKWTRRFVLPFFIALNSYLQKQKEKAGKLKSILLFPLLTLAFSLGYGEKRPYLQKFLIGWTWVAPKLIFFGFSWLAVAVPFIWITLFWLSNHKSYSNIFKWHIIEIIVGGCVGMAYA
jgi:hypothetical protein